LYILVVLNAPILLTGFKLLGFWELRTSFLTSKSAR
jgi:hypothetical protein